MKLKVYQSKYKWNHFKLLNQVIKYYNKNIELFKTPLYSNFFNHLGCTETNLKQYGSKF
jgi:hypothetical protein